MGLCSRCGNPVTFRYVNGRCIPIHSSGSCIKNGSETVVDYSGSKSSKNSSCFCTSCPKCGGKVFFLRHNGGSVWLDAPLGWPWYKHPCFESQKALMEGSQDDMESVTNFQIEDKNQELGVVTRTSVEKHKNYTDVVFETGEKEVHELRIKNSAGFLLGKLCIFDLVCQEIWPFFEPDYKFILYDAEKHGYVIPPPDDRAKKRLASVNKGKPAFVKCPVCGCVLNLSKKRKHMRKAHGIELSKKQIVASWRAEQESSLK